MNNENTSENQGNLEAATGEKKFNYKQYKRDIYFIAALIILVILFPFGVLPYFWGRMNLMIHPIVLISFPIWLLMLILFVGGIFRLFRKNTGKKKFFIFIEICLSAMFFIPFFIPLDMRPNFYDSSHPFLCGYRDRIRNGLDIKAVREWMISYKENYSDPNNRLENGNISPDKMPECLKPIRFGGALTIGINRDGNPIIYQFCGATFTSWRLFIGMEDMPFPDSEFYKEHALLWLPVAPGIYVEMD